jgi:hypothetical protein
MVDPAWQSFTTSGLALSHAISGELPPSPAAGIEHGLGNRTTIVGTTVAD